MVEDRGLKVDDLILIKKGGIMAKIVLKRQACEVFSRIVGYLRPVSQWNDGKQAEFDQRKTFEIKE